MPVNLVFFIVVLEEDGNVNGVFFFLVTIEYERSENFNAITVLG